MVEITRRAHREVVVNARFACNVPQLLLSLLLEEVELPSIDRWDPRTLRRKGSSACRKFINAKLGPEKANSDDLPGLAPHIVREILSNVSVGNKIHPK